MKPKLMLRDFIGRSIMASPRLRRIAWRAGRSLYCLARGEQRIDDMRVDGELDLQRRVTKAARAEPRFVAFDVGANEGDWTLALIDALISSEGSADRLEAHVFEPIPSTRDRLAARLDEAALPRVRINAIAASDRIGTAQMAIMSETGGTNSLVYGKDMASQALGFVLAELTTLDQYCDSAKVERIHIVKCDTEGHDLSVLRGATGLLRSGRIDIFQFEYNHRWISARSYLRDVFDLIDGLPYRLGRVMPTSIEIFDAWHPELERYFQANYVLIREPALKWVSFINGGFDNSNIYQEAEKND